MRNNDYYEKQLMASHDEPKARDFWQEKLSGEISKASFPYDHDDAGEGYRWDKVQLKLHRELVSKVISASKQSDYALHIILAAGLVLLLGKYTYNYNSGSDIIIGTPIYRQDVDGEFINTLLPLRIQQEDNLSFKDLLQRVKQSVVEAVNHQNYPIELLIRQLDLPPASGSREDFPLFDTLILLENIHDKKYIQHINVNTVFTFYRDGDLLTGELEYNTQRFEKTTIRQITDHFTLLLKSALFNAGLKCSEIGVLTESEKEQLLEEFNCTAEDYPSAKTLYELFDEQVRKTPTNIAALGPTAGMGVEEAPGEDLGEISYKELNERSDQLAQLLRKKGVKADTIVPVIVERSIEMIIVLTAILKAGGAFLPIEPNNPGDRIDYLLNESGAAMVVTQRHIYEIGMKDKNGKGVGIEPVFIEEQLSALEPTSTSTSPPPSPAALIAGTTNLAYVIYTSGTVGKPKGVLVEHRGVVNYTCWKLNACSLTGKEVTLQLLSYSFDGFGSNFYPSLLSGGSLILIPESKRLDYEYIKNIIKEREVTHMALVPAMYEALVNCSEENDLKSLKSVVLGGERAGDQLVKRSKRKNPKLLHIIEYGPTETTIAAAANPGISAAETAIIGKPIANTHIFILDQSLHPQPKGAAGELCAAGAGVARGYLNQPELTAEKFIDAENISGDRLYRTGDLARWLSNGTIEFLGRIDQQVKIKGFRVELEEIENRLLQHEEIEEGVAVTREILRDDQLELELAAYYKTKSNRDIPTNEIRQFLADQLPDYMIPSHFLRLEEFPLNANGKIDRKALGSAEKFEIEVETEDDRSLNEIEQRIFQVWKNVIGTEDISVNDNFFSIGGTSIKALTVISQLGRELDISIDHIYQYGTIAGIAKNLSWKTDSLKTRILVIKKNLGKEKPAARDDSSPQRTQFEEEYKAYIHGIENENLPDLTAAKDYHHIFLTGGTGFLGAHLIDQILKVTDAELHLLTRGDTPGEAQERLKGRLIHYFGENFFEKNKKRLHVVQGDIRGENLGIDDGLYEELAGVVDAILHSAADVRAFGMYEDFYKVNVEGTENVLELADRGRKKDFHYISTVGVGDGNIEGKPAFNFTEFCHDVGQQLGSVYLKSKLEGEKKVLLYREKGIDGSIYRVANLVSHSKTGIFQENIASDASYALLKAFIILEMMPDLGGTFPDMSFVDYSAAATVKLMTRKHLENETYHLNNTKHIKWLEMVKILNKAKVKIRLVTLDEFLDHLMDCMDKDDDKYMEATSRLLLHAGLFGDVKDTDEPAVNTVTRICTSRTLRILKYLDFEWVPPNKSNIGKMIRYCRKVGFLP